MATIDPLLSLAVSMQSNPGVYALLLGSGVSRSAGVPTGWEVVIDLIKRLAVAEDQQCEPDLESWYRQKYNTEPSYSGLLDAVAKSQAERSQLLKSYFEPSDEERENDLKLPTAAHHAIARLVKDGYVRVILTTNFDRLMEQALQAVGVQPTVIASLDAMDGAMPLVHSNCTLVKLHGDYLDIRTKNTPIELGEYDSRTNQLLDRILDDFGLVVCGWSGQWDIALRKAIERCKSRRFTTYWTVKAGAINDTATELMTLRSAQEIGIAGADEFFANLGEKVEALASLSQPHPLSTKVAVAQTKKYVIDPKFRIQLHDLLMGEVEQIVKTAWSPDYPVNGSIDGPSVTKRLSDFEGISSVACAIASTGCRWSGPEHHELWVAALTRLGNPERSQGGKSCLLSLRSYPALLVFYAAGIGAAHGRNYNTINKLLCEPRIYSGSHPETYPRELFTALKPEVFKAVDGLKKKKLPRSERLFNILREPLREIIPADADYQRSFDTFETLQALHCADTTGYAMPGAFMYRYYLIRGDQLIPRADGSPLLEMDKEVSSLGTSTPVLQSGFLDESKERWEKAVEKVHEMTQRCNF